MWVKYGLIVSPLWLGSDDDLDRVSVGIPEIDIEQWLLHHDSALGMEFLSG